MPIGSAISRTVARWLLDSLQVSWMVSSGAPDNSNWPPGSIEIAPMPVGSLSPMMLPRSMIGSQPLFSCSPFRSAEMLASPK